MSAIYRVEQSLVEVEWLYGLGVQSVGVAVWGGRFRCWLKAWELHVRQPELRQPEPARPA